jgi:bacillithiol synthase
MHKDQLPYAQTGRFSALIQDYLDRNDKLTPFYGRFPEYAAFADQMSDKSENYQNRTGLSTALRAQYAKAQIQSTLIDRLAKPNCFTITTGHQLCLFTGPLYFIYKIVTAIKLAEELCKKYPDSDFVPVFWMASEDHDFDEINHAHLFGKKLIWESGQAGAVGRMEPTAINEVIAELDEILGNSTLAEEAKSLIKDAYLKSKDWASATRKLVIALFGENRLLVIDGDDKELKNLFVPQVLKELDEQLSFTEVEKTGVELGVQYTLQVSPREINLFYLGEQTRERIVFQDGIYKILHSSLFFTPEEIVKEVQANPQNFSPNVILRPLYQETILPNLAYIGGGGELAYWFQLRSMFSSFGVSFPMLVLRNSVLWVGKNEMRKLQNLHLKIVDLFGNKEQLIQKLVINQADSEISLDGEKDQLAALFEGIAERAAGIDPTLKGMVLADEKRALNSLETIEKRMMKAEKDKHSQSINQLTSLFDKLFPGEGLQERHNNFFEYYLKYGPEFIETLIKELDPLNFSFTIFSEEA